MRVKVGDQWFEVGPGQPVMVELSEQDKQNIANMNADATKYALFSDEDGWSADEKFEWMRAGARL